MRVCVSFACLCGSVGVSVSVRNGACLCVSVRVCAGLRGFVRGLADVSEVLSASSIIP